MSLLFSLSGLFQERKYFHSSTEAMLGSHYSWQHVVAIQEFLCSLRPNNPGTLGFYHKRGILVLTVPTFSRSWVAQIQHPTWQHLMNLKLWTKHPVCY